MNTSQTVVVSSNKTGEQDITDCWLVFCRVQFLMLKAGSIVMDIIFLCIFASDGEPGALDWTLRDSHETSAIQNEVIPCVYRIYFYLRLENLFKTYMLTWD